MVQQWLEEDPRQRAAIADLANRAQLGERIFLRRFKKATGENNYLPLAPINGSLFSTSLRVVSQLAKNLLGVTKMG